MKALVCEHCGGDEFEEKDGYRICLYCKSKFVATKEVKKAKAEANLNDDVKRLIAKCKRDPARAAKYATLVLEIDPANQEAISILNNL